MKEIILKPSGWRSVPAWSLFTRVKRTGFPNAELLSVYRDHGVIPKASREDNHNVASEDLASYQFVEQGDLVVNKMKAWQGTFAVSEYEGIVSPAYFVFKPHHSESSKFLHYLLRSAPYIAHYNQISNGVRIGQWDLDPAQFRITQVVLPPLNEQKAIADFLDRELAQIDASIEKLNKVVLNLDERQRSLIWSMVTKSLNDNSGVKYSGLSWITDVPSHWEIRKVAGIHKFVTGGTPNSSNQEFYNGTYPWITIADLNGGEIRETKSALSEAGVKAANLKMVPKGALLFSFKLSVGQVAFTGLDCYTNEAIAAFIPNEVIHQRWAFYAYPVFLIQNANWNIYGARLMNASLIRGARILLPPIKEQETIATILDQKLEEIQRLRNKCQASAELLYDRRQSLVSAAVTGKLDVQKVA